LHRHSVPWIINDSFTLGELMAKLASALLAAEHKIEGFAEDLGKMLGHARTKAEGWLSQRQAIVRNLTELRDTATKLLTDLGHQAERVVRRGRKPGRKPGRPIGSGVKKKRTMSAEARKRISDAQKARWAKLKAGEKRK
jgi:hypothetical protein